MPKGKQFDPVDFVIEYESGMLDEDGIIAGFQELIDSGIAWKLQGHYGRTAQLLIENGHCVLPSPTK